jgi:predicted aldo/keto reductase-like oxidoreductase
MCNKPDWNRREFIVKPIVWAGAAGMLARTGFLLGESAPAAVTGSVLQRTLGKTGIQLPVVSMGVMNADIPGLLRRAYELGIRHFDTAAVYQQGRNEEMVGSVIKELAVRNTVTISTKQPVRNYRQPDSEVKKRFIEGVEASLQRLQMDHVDILYYHAADSADAAKAQGPLEGLQTLKRDGKTRFIGISTHKTVEVLNAVIPLKLFDVTLVTLNYTMAHEPGILAAIERAANNGIGVVAMKTQAGGTVKPDTQLPQLLPAASQTALLKWVLNHEFVTTAIPGFSTYEHLEQDFAVARNLSYTEDEKAFLADKAFVAEAQFCQQCGQCRQDCPKRADIPRLMRSHMYAVQYRNAAMARDTLAAISPGQGLDACGNCDSCLVACRHHVQIGRKIGELKELPLFA